MGADDLITVLQWLHGRLEHQLTIDAGTHTLDGAMVRGKEPPDGHDDERPDSYELTVYTPAFTLRLEPDDLQAEIVGDELRLWTRSGKLGIRDEDAVPADDGEPD